jgi:hypothetical protein
LTNWSYDLASYHTTETKGDTWRWTRNAGLGSSVRTLFEKAADLPKAVRERWLRWFKLWYSGSSTHTAMILSSFSTCDKKKQRIWYNCTLDATMVVQISWIVAEIERSVCLPDLAYAWGQWPWRGGRCRGVLVPGCKHHSLVRK